MGKRAFLRLKGYMLKGYCAAVLIHVREWKSGPASISANFVSEDYVRELDRAAD